MHILLRTRDIKTFVNNQNYDVTLHNNLLKYHVYLYVESRDVGSRICNFDLKFQVFTKKFLQIYFFLQITFSLRVHCISFKTQTSLYKTFQVPEHKIFGNFLPLCTSTELTLNQMP